MPPLHLFEAFGVELEYMLVNQQTLDVEPAVDHIFHAIKGSYVSDIEDGPITWSNELVRHVMEVKVSHPVASWQGLEDVFAGSIQKFNAAAARKSSCLMPTAIHPWMDPATETELWPHEYAEIYQMFHRVFDCHRHGWANLQSVHVNLPFYGDQEFARLHAAIRLVLPIIPALAASSPVVEGRITGIKDNRLDVYCNNSRLISEIAGDVIPEPFFSEAAYRQGILEPMYRAIAPYDEAGVLQDEFLNARGAIARFDRSAIEIRLIDVQECPLADIAIVQAVVHAVRSLVNETTAPWDRQAGWSAARLRSILNDHIIHAENTMIGDGDFLRLWGITETSSCASRSLWQHILRDFAPSSARIGTAVDTILNRGTLASRMLDRLPAHPDRHQLQQLYRQLATCLENNVMLAG